LLRVDDHRDEDSVSPKYIRFLTLPAAKDRRAGIGRTADGRVLGLWDRWGRPFHVRLDTDYDEAIDDPFRPGCKVKGPRALVWSHGKNGRNDGGTGDDVTSWR
jgi:hypothetical protein